MKALILAAGYATRLYPLTLDTPKPMLEVGGKTIIDRIREKLETIENLNEIVVVTNEKFFGHFEKWGAACGSKIPIKVLNDKTESNKTRLGAIGDIRFVMDNVKIDDDLVIVAGDNLFEFDINKFVDFSGSKIPNCSIVLHYVKEIEHAKRYGVVKIDGDAKVVDFKEKPEKPESNLVAICIYYFPKDKLELVREYLKTSNEKDAPGHYIRWLSEREPVYGFVFSEPWYDIGNIETYEEAKKEFEKGAK